PLTSGGHVVPCSGDVFSVGCASATLAGATPTNAAMIRMTDAKGSPRAVAERRCQRFEAQRVPEALQGRAREWALTLWAQKAVAVFWSVATVSAVKSHERASLGRDARSLDRSVRLDPNRRRITRGQ